MGGALIKKGWYMKAILWVVTLAFAALTAVAVQQHGLTGILTYQLANTAGLQVLVDLAIALGLFIFWMWQDAKTKCISPWPWLVVTLLIGSFGPLFYLLYRQTKRS